MSIPAQKRFRTDNKALNKRDTVNGLKDWMQGFGIALLMLPIICVLMAYDIFNRETIYLIVVFLGGGIIIFIEIFRIKGKDHKRNIYRFIIFSLVWLIIIISIWIATRFGLTIRHGIIQSLIYGLFLGSGWFYISEKLWRFIRKRFRKHFR